MNAHMKESLLGTIVALFVGAGCNIPKTDDASFEEELISTVSSQLFEVTSSFTYATKTGIELEIEYQTGLKKQKAGTHLITVGENPPSGSSGYMGNLEAVVRTLQQNLQGNVEIEYIHSRSDLIAAITKERTAPLDSIHSFGHGDPTSYWITEYETEKSFTLQDVRDFSPELKEQIKTHISSEGYWKFYICHGAANTANNYYNEIKGNENIAYTVAQELGITTIASNAWVFLEQRGTNFFMFPASRTRHYDEFVEKKPGLNIATPDPLYSGEAAWLTYTPKEIKEE